MIVDSSVWGEPDFVCKIFITMLALKDSDDVCRCNAYQLAQRARKSEVEVLEALRVLSSPDTRRVEKQQFEGRRIEAVEDGWLILNGPKYREMVQDEMRKARWRRAQAEKRRKEREKALKNGTPSAGEMAHEKAFESGATDAQLGSIQDEANSRNYR
jgi:hypothetical protein